MGLGACAKGKGKEDKVEDKRPTLGEQVGNIVSDERVLGEASAAVNRVVRYADDCEGVNAALPEANLKIAEASGKLRTPAGRATLEALKAKLQSAVQACN